MKDMHAYPGPGMFPVMPDRVSVLGEFGGLGLPVKGHLWKDSDNWGYRTFQNEADLRAAYAGEPLPDPPTVGEVADTIREHAALLAEHQSEHHATLAIRKHVGWYLTGYPVGGAIRRRIVESASLAEIGRAHV